MQLDGAVALVTGANRGLGRAYAEALLDAGAAKVYAAARNPDTITDPRLTPIGLDVTDHAQVAEVARTLADVDLVINNAGIAHPGLPLDADLDAAREQLEVNYLGPLAVAQAFAPVLRANGGGALVNVLSVLSFVALPQLSTYAASKAAAWSITNALREQLGEQGTLVVGVHAGYIDTDMAAHVPEDQKIPPQQVVDATLDALRNDEPEVLADELTRGAKAALATAV
jgi:NAD(P)-dependent dehydrogenase (short-subunit alcohol dehydrogenase family)